MSGQLLFFLSFFLFLPAASAAEFSLPEGARQAADTITSEGLRPTVAILADDLLGGRQPGTAGDRLARQMIAARLQALGLQPGAPDGWQQEFPMVGVNATVPDSWQFRGSELKLELDRWGDFIAASGVQAPLAELRDAELVFVGYGIRAPEFDWDDYKGTDLRGKVLVMLNNDPDWDENLFGGKRRLYYGRWTYKYEEAARQGAAGAIIIHTTSSAGYPWQVVQRSWSGPQFELPAGDEPRIQVAAWVTDAAATKLFALAGQSLDELRTRARERDFRPVPLGIHTGFALHNELTRITTGNVLGLLPGSDEKLKNEVVVYTAHHDHLGIGTPDDQGDRIYNGARDNALGVAEVLAIARAYTALPHPPRRSVLFALVGAEEQGLLGSKHYASNPTFEPGRIAANINYDTGNIWGRTRDVIYVGYGKSSMSEIVDYVAGLQDRKVFADNYPDRGFFYRSDQLNFARIGVPAVYMRVGTDYRNHPPGWAKENGFVAWEKKHYHQPSDHLRANWNFEGVIEDAQLGFLAGLIVAEQDGLPEWRAGDEFEAARKAALDALK
ncbi:MAG: M28 family metallopeptidase [Gammaproteobacteria bacterium]|nr:M28 family metallopeptidase [Gammaproteobacteria bacterium]